MTFVEIMKTSIIFVEFGEFSEFIDSGSYSGKTGMAFFRRCVTSLSHSWHFKLLM